MVTAKKVLTADALGSNIEGDTADVGIDTAASPAKRVRIMLEENDNIPPTGQFFGANGRAYILRPGEEVDVPPEILSILDTAVMSTPILDGGSTVIGYRDKLRFPYRVIQGARI